MTQETLYAEQWDESAKYFYDTKRYHWMAEKISDYKTVVEVGCGTGYSTVALVETGHKVIAIDKNSNCLEKAKELIDDRGLGDEVIFVEGDIATDEFRSFLKNQYDYDVVVCWNVGTYWSKEMIQFYFPYLLEYGLNVTQIRENPESPYAELIIWDSCRLASDSNVPVQIVDRGTQYINYQNDSYYKTLGAEFSYLEIKYDNLECDTISSKGRMLSTNGVVNDSEKIEIVLVSILLK